MKRKRALFGDRVSWIGKDVFALYVHIIFELQMQYETTIDLSQQLVTQHADGFSDTSFIDGSDLVAKSSSILR
jgi:hypothetical protein